MPPKSKSSKKPYIRLHVQRNEPDDGTLWWKAVGKKPRAHTAHDGLWCPSAKRAVYECMEELGIPC